MKPMSAPPGTPPKGNLYSRFIPREELSSFEAWTPGALSPSGKGTLSGHAASGPLGGTDATSTATAAEELAKQVRAARQAGYQDGYRDGLVALDGFKQSFAAQTTAQLGALLESAGQQLDALQEQMASALTDAATGLARQIVRSELSTRPELVAEVAQQALDALMLSARHISLRLHPDDQALVAHALHDSLAARGARLIADATLQRGGCRIDSDIGSVDATIAARWRRCIAAVGLEQGWDDGLAPAQDTQVSAPLSAPENVAANVAATNPAPAPTPAAATTQGPAETPSAPALAADADGPAPPPPETT